MKLFFFLGLFFISNQLDAQFFNIDPKIKDSINPTTYNYRILGNGWFTDSLIVNIELIDPKSPSVSKFSGNVNFLTSKLQNVPSFEYDPTNSVFRMNLGTFPISNLILHMWVVDRGQIKNEIYFNQK